MQPTERQSVLEQLVSSEDRVLHLVAGLTPAQWAFHESPDRWSIAEIVEHLNRLEAVLLKGIHNALASPAQTEKMAAALTRDAAIASAGLPQARTRKVDAPDNVRPRGAFTDTAAMLAALKQTRAATSAFASSTEDALREHFFPHPVFGDMDCYQWLILIAQHSLRHAHQIEEIKANPNYPKS